MSCLEVQRCVECDCEVRVPLTLPYEGDEQPTGMPLDYMDENGNDHLLGVLCADCAFRLCDEGVLGIGYAGFPHSWEAVIFGTHKPHSFPFEEKNGLECHCSICTEEDWEDDPWEAWN